MDRDRQVESPMVNPVPPPAIGAPGSAVDVIDIDPGATGGIVHIQGAVGNKLHIMWAIRIPMLADPAKQFTSANSMVDVMKPSVLFLIPVFHGFPSQRLCQLACADVKEGSAAVLGPGKLL